ncbi:hypothetical protein [Streptomyces sp. bgisy084]|uniref:hypothetical protein n=1 Tax=Streptomyces sp. bgisy084 TaxID=3413777 RepID=UPI003D713677
MRRTPLRLALPAVAAACLLAAGCTTEPQGDQSIPATLPSQPPGDDTGNHADAASFTASLMAKDKPALGLEQIITTVEGDEPYTYLVINAKGTPASEKINELITSYMAWKDRGAKPVMVGVFNANGKRVGSAATG